MRPRVCAIWRTSNALALERVPLNRGQRVRRVLAALDELGTQIERVELLDDIVVVAGDVARACGSSALTSRRRARRRRRVVREGSDLRARAGNASRTSPSTPDVRAVTKRTLRGDGTFVVLRGASRDITAQAVAECIVTREASAATNAVLVIAEHDGIILDNAMERAGLPRAGFQHYSRFRAVSQLLKLALSLIWRPVSPHLLLQFLIHPIGPLPRHVRDALASAVAEQPGTGGGKWRDALLRAQTRMREDFGADEKAVAKLQATIVGLARRRPVRSGGRRADRSARAPHAAVFDVSGASSSMRSNDEAERGPVCRTRSAQSEALLRALRALDAQGQPTVRRIDVDRLIDEVSSVAPDPNTFAQARHVAAATAPCAVTQDVAARVLVGSVAADARESAIRGRAKRRRGCAQTGWACSTNRR